MKPYTDDELTQKLGALNELFKPTMNQKEKMNQSVFHSKSIKTKRSRFHWKSAVVSMVLVFSILFSVTFLLDKQSLFSSGSIAEDVTDSWENIIMTQHGPSDVTTYYIVFDGETLHIKNDYIGDSFMGTEQSESEIRAAAEVYEAKMAKKILQVGEYENYNIKKVKDQYTITIPGENGFSYTLEKTAPRQFTGEDGIRYSVNNYID